MKNLSRSLIAAVALIALAGCSEEQSPAAEQQAEEPAANEENPPADEGTSTEEAGEQLGEAAKSALERAEELAQDARDAASEALEDAAPALEKAGEVATQFKEAVDEIVAQGAKDLEQAAQALEERIAEATGEPSPEATGNPDAVLAPADQLKADTRAAARAAPAGVGPAYVGVWAQDAASCAKIDQEPVEIFAVITPTTIRRYESVCNIEEAPLAEGEVTVQASCIAEGTTENRQIKLTMPSGDTLRIEYDGAPGGADLVRCHLPQ